MILSRRQILAGAAAVPVVLATGTTAFAATAPIYAENGIAIDGTDPVSYFTEGRPVAGDANITHDWMGATWRFSSEANRTAFVENPEAYAPQYGGYCAWAVSEGYTASTTPKAWKIVDDKLYLNYSRRVQRWWERDIPARISAADSNWPTVLE